MDADIFDALNTDARTTVQRRGSGRNDRDRPKEREKMAKAKKLELQAAELDTMQLGIVISSAREPTGVPIHCPLLPICLAASIQYPVSLPSKIYDLFQIGNLDENCFSSYLSFVILATILN
jgi:hypothetical protein